LINERRAFGERLRRQRERQQVTLEEIAEATKVAASLFAGLERGDCSRWPGGFYSRSFIRGYAAAVQLDPAETTAEFAEYYDAADPHPDPHPRTQTTEPSAPKAAPRSARVPLRLSFVVDPTEPYWQAARRTGHALADLALIMALGYLVGVGAGVSFWLSLSVTSLGYHFLGRVLPSVSPTGRLMSPKRQVVSEPTAFALEEEDAPVGDTASTIA
jgi:transcriptional regulator with XRE-family HTH domain